VYTRGDIRGGVLPDTKGVFGPPAKNILITSKCPLKFQAKGIPRIKRVKKLLKEPISFGKNFLNLEELNQELVGEEEPKEGNKIPKEAK